MNTDFRISVIVPVYNTEKYLDKCVESIVSQTYTNLEIILVDDGSFDNSPQMCDAWAGKDERIKVIHKENGGVSSARNAGLDIAQGEYISFVDSDDWIEQDMLELLMKNAADTGADIARCGYFFVDETTGEKVCDEKEAPDVLIDREDIVKKTVVGFAGGYIWGRIFKAKLFENIRFDNEIYYSEGLLVNYQISKIAQSMIFSTAPKYNFLQRVLSEEERAMNEHSFDTLIVVGQLIDGEKDNAEIRPYCIKGYTDAAFTVLSGVITNQKCLDRYDWLRKNILRFKKEIFFGGMHSTLDKVKTFLLMLSPKLYNLVIRKIRNA